MARSSALAVVLLLCVAGTALAAGSRDPSIDEVISTLKALKASSSVPSRASAAARVAAASATPAGRPAAVRAAAAYLDAAPEIVFDSGDEESAYPLPDAALAGASAAMDAITPPAAAAAGAAAPSSGSVAAQGAAAEPQHAPQFPVEDASKQQAAGKRPISSVPATPAPLPAKEPVQQQQQQQQQPAQQQQQQKPAAAAPQKPVPAPAPQQKPVPAPAPQQKQAAPVTPPKAVTPAPAAAAPKKAEAPQQPAAEAPKPAEAPKKEEPEDPCKKIPGCLSCKAQGATGHSFTRKLRQFGHGGHAGHHGNMGMDSLSGGGEQKQGRPNFDLSSMYDSVYNTKDLPYCSACNTTGGYVAHSKGRCACAPGYGDMTPSGTCSKCAGGYFSSGGFRAVCTECEGVAFANADRTACICASGWYGLTSYATKQASCNQCPGSRPVAREGTRSSAECRACDEGFRANDIFSDCVNATAPQVIVADPELDKLLPESNVTAAPVAPLFNESTFEHAREEWTITTRNTQNFTNPVSDLFGSIMDSMFSGKNITATAKQPGDLLYQLLTKPAAPAPKLPTLPSIDLQNPQQLGAGLGAALATAPKLLSAAAKNGGKIQDVVDSVVKAVETGTQSAAAMPTAPGAATGGWGDFLKGLSATVPKDASGKSSLVDLAKSMGDLFGSASKAAGSMVEQVSSNADNEFVKGLGGLLAAAGKDGAAPAAATPAASAGGSDWGSMLTNMFAAPAAAAPPAPLVPAPSASGGADWTKWLGALTKPATAPAAPAAGGNVGMQDLLNNMLSRDAASGAGDAAAGGGGTADIAKMLAGLTAPAAKIKSKNPHTITVGYEGPAAGYTSGAAQQVGGLIGDQALPAARWEDPDVHQTVKKVVQGNAAPKVAANKGKSSFSFANPNGQKAQVQGQKGVGGFIAVPSAPPKKAGDKAKTAGKKQQQPKQQQQQA